METIVLLGEDIEGVSYMLEKKLKLALSSNDRTIIEGVFNEIYHKYYKLIYFVAGQYLKDDYENRLKECKNSNNLLTEAKASLKEQVEQMKEDCTKKEELETELENLQKKHNKLTIEFDTLKANLSDFQLKHEESINEIKKHENEQIERVKEQCKIEQEKALLELEKKYQKEILELKEQKQTEIDKYQSKHYELLEQMEQKKKSNSKRKKEEN